MNRDEIIEMCKRSHDIDYDYSLVKDVSNKDECIDVICKKHGIFRPRLSRFLKGSNCPLCAKKGIKTTEMFVEEYKEKYGIYDLSKFSYINSHTKGVAICSKHGEFEISPTNLLNGVGCPECKREKLKDFFSSDYKKFNEKAKKIHGDKYSYFDDYVDNHTPIKILCNICGNVFYQLPHNHLQGKGCPYCNESKLEKYVEKELVKYGIKYEKQKRFEWLGKKSVDFYLCDYDVIIECQGKQHFNQTYYGKLDENINRDYEKYISCIKNGYKVIYILDKLYEDMPLFYNLSNTFTKEDNFFEFNFCEMNNFETFIEKANKTHNGKYDYSKVEYKGSLEKVCIICPEHGEFWQTPSSHVRGRGCPLCGNGRKGLKRLTIDEFINKSNEIHGCKYDYSNVEYVNTETPIRIICPIHGEFEMTPNAHLYGKQGCPKCAGRNLTQEEVIERFKSVHGDEYDYSNVVFSKIGEKVDIICKKHGLFKQTPSKHILGHGCPICAVENRAMKRELTTEEFIRKAREVHGDKYDYSSTEYKGTYNNVNIICRKHGMFAQRANDHLNGHGCPKCGNIQPIWENEINDYIVKELGIDTVMHDRKAIGNGMEIDIYVPSLHIGIECDGLKWHSEEYKDKNYHLEKTNECLKNGIRLIHIFEDEWENQKDLVKDMISISLGKCNERIYARNCTVMEIDGITKKEFIRENHIQRDVPSKINIGLFHNGELVAAMTFGGKRINLGFKKSDDCEYELLRLCTKRGLSVVGGSSKMFKYFIDRYNPRQVLSFCDKRWSVGNVYYKLGFELDHESQPNYFYVVDKQRKNRFNYRKDMLVSQGFDKGKTEHEIMLERKIYRIYDCGQYVFKYKNG